MNTNTRWKLKPIPFFTGLAVVTIGTLGYMTFDKNQIAQKPVEVTATPPAKIEEAAKTAEAPAPAKVEAAKPAEVAAAPEAEAPKVETPAAPAVAEAPKVETPPAAETQVAIAEAPAAVQPTPEIDPAKSLAIDEATDDGSPSFDTVRVEPDGSAVVAGRGKPGEEIEVTFNGKVIGKAVAGADGTFVVIPDDPIPAGTGSLALQSKNGNSTVVSKNEVAIAIKPKTNAQPEGEAMVALVQPEGATKVIQVPGTKPVAPSNVVKLDSVDYDATGNIIFSGRSEKGSTVRIYVDNNLAGEVKVDKDGRWMFGGNATVATGKHTLRADEVGVDGLVKSRVELPFLREEQSKVAAIQQSTTAETPVAAATPAAVEPVLGPERIVIQPGNNLWKLSRVIYGKGTRYTVIYEANKDQIRDPNRIYPGQVFAAPKLN